MERTRSTARGLKCSFIARIHLNHGSIPCLLFITVVAVDFLLVVLAVLFLPLPQHNSQFMGP